VWWLFTLHDTDLQAMHSVLRLHQQFAMMGAYLYNNLPPKKLSGGL
jgi:hypothetical protein